MGVFDEDRIPIFPKKIGILIQPQESRAAMNSPRYKAAPHKWGLWNVRASGKPA
jgi:hypothetical protein